MLQIGGEPQQDGEETKSAPEATNGTTQESAAYRSHENVAVQGAAAQRPPRQRAQEPNAPSKA